MSSFAHQPYPYRDTPDAVAASVPEHELVIVGAGPVGLTAALDFARHGRRVLLLAAGDTVCSGSRAICWAKRTLEIFDRLGIGQAVVDQGVTWSKGRVFVGAEEIWQFDLLPEPGHRMPAFVNLQQYHVEHCLIAACGAQPLIEIRWRTRLAGLAPRADGALLELESPQGPYRLHASWLIACDGVRSQVRRGLGLPFKGQVFEDRFLIADVRMQADLPAERWFWFAPPFHAGGSALLHRQPENIWRIDLQLGREADPDVERRPERVLPRLQAIFGPEQAFELLWVSVYTFQCRRLGRFRHGRILFAGDSAHQVSPFGARGGNSGIQDADNLVWKLDLVLQGRAPESLLESYDAERGRAADENIAHSTRATDFITPKSAGSRTLREATLELARTQPFARALVNSGRLSKPTVYLGSALNGPDDGAMPRALTPGAAAVDAPLQQGGARKWLLHELGGEFVGLYAGRSGDVRGCLQAHAGSGRHAPLRLRTLDGSPAGLGDPEGLARERWGLTPGSFYLVRPDQHIAARWRRLDREAILEALGQASGGQASGGRSAAP